MSILATDIAYALLHSLWQIGLIALAYALVLVAVRSAQVRYVLGCSALTLSLACPLGWLLFTGEWLAKKSEQADVAESTPSVPRDLARFPSERPFIANHSDARPSVDIGVEELPRAATNTAQSLEGRRQVAWLTIVWLVGVCVVGIRIPLGFRSALGLMHCSFPVHNDVINLAERQCRRLSLRCSVLVAQSEKVLVPCVVGVFKPTVLLPTSLVTGLTTSELEAILAHELAHIRRHDFVVNLFQSAIESVLFYHPAVWWISRSVRHERENCCDDLALTVCRDRKVYASALLALGKMTPSVTVAANGGALFKRVKRILGQSNANVSSRSALVAACGAAILVLAVAAMACHETEDSRSAEKEERVMGNESNRELGDEQVRAPWRVFIEVFENGGDAAIVELVNSGGIGVNEFDGNGGSALTYCAYSGNVELAEQLVALGADVNGRHPNTHMTPMHTAAAFNHPEMVTFLLDREANPDIATSSGTQSPAFYSPHGGETPLHLAVAQENTEVIRILLAAGAHLHTKDADGKRPIDYLNDAAKQANEIRKLFDDRAAYLNRWQISDWQRAIENDDVDRVRELLEESQRRCVKCLQKFRTDGTWYLVDPLCEAARRNCVPIVKAMLEHKRLSNYTVGLGQYNGEIKGAHCLAWAASEEMRQLLIHSGADPATIDGIEIPNINEESVPFEQTTNDLGLRWQLAVESRDEDRIRELLAVHPHLSRQVIMERWRDGRMGHRSLDPLYQMAQSGHLDMVKLMVEKGYDKSKLVGAVELAAPEVAAYLIDDLGVEAKPNVGLMAYIGDTASLKFWLDRGHKPEGRMLLDACGSRGRFRGYKFDIHTGWPERFRETIRVLVEAGVDVNARMPSGNEKYEGCKPWRANGETPLHFSAGNWDPVQVQMLLDAGADKTLKNDLGETPYDWAVEFGAPEETKELLKLGDRGNESSEADVLLEYGAEHDVYTAAIAGDLEVLQRLIKEDPESLDKIRPDYYGRSPLDQALTVGQLESAELLANNGAKVGPHAAAAMGRIDQVKTFLQEDSQATTRFFGKQPLLIWAIQCGQVEVVKMLLERGADPNGSDEWSVTPLRTVAQVKGEAGAAIVDLLVASGADIEQ